ncbi:hypothetical protein LIER_33845 [Lithospermum erythrorhizon]|uniref:CCHC-type domain-containing protein n=1 Tax=Lithospermum erythrorhizon TaxID=34254 RepID=A0AAV3S1Q1_LITER
MESDLARVLGSLWLEGGGTKGGFGKTVGADIGEVIEVDKKSIEKERGRYVRVKVQLNINKPLKRGRLVPMRVNKIKIVYRYKKVCDVCLYCGMLGHKYHNCEENFLDEARKISRVDKFDSWMLVHGARRGQGRRKEKRREPWGYRGEGETSWRRK